MLICAYLSLNTTLEEFESHTARNIKYVDKIKEKFIILGDFNAKSIKWRSPSTNKGVTIVIKHVVLTYLVIHNIGNKPTFLKNTSKLYLDTTLMEQKAANQKVASIHHI